MRVWTSVKGLRVAGERLDFSLHYSELNLEWLCPSQWGYTSWLSAQYFGSLDQLSFHLCSQTAADKSWPCLCSFWWLNPQHRLTYQPSVHKAQLIGSDPPERKEVPGAMLIFTRKCSKLATRFPYRKELTGFFSEVKLVIKDNSFLISWVGNMFIMWVFAGEVRRLFPSHWDVFVPPPLLSETRLCFGCSNVCPPLSSWVLMSQSLPKWSLFLLILPYKVNK